MFGTNVPSPAQQNTQQPPMPKQNILTTGVTSPVAKSPQNDNFSDFWANSNSKPSQGATQPVQSPLNKPPQPPQIPSTGNKPPVQPNPPVQPPLTQNGNGPKPADKPKTTTFNQLFGLGPKS